MSVAFVSWPDGGFNGCWDHGIINEAIHGISRPGWPGITGETSDDHRSHAVVHVSGRFHTDKIDQLNADMARWEGVVLIVTSDEEHLFPVENVVHPNMLIWRQLPRVDHLTWELVDRGFGEGPPDHTVLPSADYGPRDLDWSFAGQITHPRREWWMTEMRKRFVALPDERAMMLLTKAFTDGVARSEYLRMIARSKTVVCPAGPVSQSSFRLYEALAMGAVPVADDARVDGEGSGYWDAVFSEPPPFPIVTTPDMAAVDAALGLGEWGRVRCMAWWQRERRQLQLDLVDALRRVGAAIPAGRLQDQLTFLVTASPVENQWAVLERTLRSLPPECEVIVAFDGVRPEQEHDRGRYEADLDFILNRLESRQNVTPFIGEGWLHQAVLAKKAMTHVHTPCVCFVEHDTPVEGAVPWKALCEAVESAVVDTIRLHHEAQIPAEHEYLMDHMGVVNGLQVMFTQQWSQRPHVAETGWYSDMLTSHFDDDDRTMVEDAVYGEGVAGGLGTMAIYHEPDETGSIRRSGHTDGRGADPKYSMTWKGQVIG